MQRNKDLDYIRGILMICVIVIHIKKFGTTYPEAKSIVEALTMPAFLLVSGYLVNIEKTTGQFLRYLWRLLLPYVVMSVAYAGVASVVPVGGELYTFTPLAIADTLLLHPIGPYWFLHALLVGGCLYYLVWRLVARRGDAMTRMAWLCVLLAVAAWALDALPLKMTLYYFAGAALRSSGIAFNRAVVPSAIAGVAVAAIVSMPAARDWGLLSTGVAVVMLLSFCRWLHQRMGTSRTDALLCWIGLNTLPIYLFHPVFTMAARYAEPLFAFDSTSLLFSLFTIVLCLAGSVVIGWIADRLHLSALFGRPQMLTTY